MHILYHFAIYNIVPTNFLGHFPHKILLSDEVKDRVTSTIAAYDNIGAKYVQFFFKE